MTGLFGRGAPVESTEGDVTERQAEQKELDAAVEAAKASAQRLYRECADLERQYQGAEATDAAQRDALAERFQKMPGRILRAQIAVKQAEVAARRHQLDGARRALPEAEAQHAQTCRRELPFGRLLADSPARAAERLGPSYDGLKRAHEDVGILERAVTRLDAELASLLAQDTIHHNLRLR